MARRRSPFRARPFLQVQLVAILFMAGGIVCKANYWSDAASPRLVLLIGCALSVGAGFLMAPMMGGADLLMVGGFLSILLLLMGFVYGPLGAWLPGLFPARVRYTGASVAFNVGGVIGGGFTPVFAQALVQQGGLSLVGVYLSVAAGLSLVALLLLRKKAID